MANCGSLLVLLCVLGAMSGSEANALDVCCPAVTAEEVKEPILGYFNQRAEPPCVTAVIFLTQSGLSCHSRRALWVRRKIVEFENKKSGPTAVSEFSSSPLSLLSIRTPTAKEPNARRLPSRSRPCCFHVTAVDRSTEVVGETYHEQDAAHPCVKAVIFNTSVKKLCADPNAQWVKDLTAGMMKV